MNNTNTNTHNITVPLNNSTTTNNINRINNSPLRIITQNVRGINDPTKRQQLIDFMDLNKVNIFGLSETKLSNSTAAFSFKQFNNKYTSFFNNDTSSTNGSGVGIIVSKDYAKFIHKTEAYKGRVLFMDLIMKGRVKIRIFQIYLPTTTTGMRDYTTDLYKYIIDKIKDALRCHSRIIIMGDFNINLEKYLKQYRRNGYTHWQNSLFKDLQRLNLVDTITLCHDITPTTPFNTFVPNHPNQSPSRIDFIWITRDLIDEVINSNIFDPELYKSDHNALYLSLTTTNLFKRKSVASLKQHNMRKRIFHYDQMDDDKWQTFAEKVDLQHDTINASNQTLSLQTMMIRNSHDLNRF